MDIIPVVVNNRLIHLNSSNISHMEKVGNYWVVWMNNGSKFQTGEDFGEAVGVDKELIKAWYDC